MKKIYMTIGAFLLCASMAMAQAPANRTAKTIAADVLAQMPAQEQQAYEDLIGQLCGAGDGAVQTLIGMINAPGKGSNAQVDYALSGLSHYVMSAGKEQARLTVSNAYCQALERVTERETKAFLIRQLEIMRETKAFLIRQLEIMGGDEAVETLAGFLGDESLSGPAARALSSIGTKQAGAALVSSLKRRMGTPKTQRDAINAIGEMPPAQVEGAEPLLLNPRRWKVRNLCSSLLSRRGQSPDCGWRRSMRWAMSGARPPWKPWRMQQRPPISRWNLLGRMKRTSNC